MEANNDVHFGDDFTRISRLEELVMLAEPFYELICVEMLITSDPVIKQNNALDYHQLAHNRVHRTATQITSKNRQSPNHA